MFTLLILCGFLLALLARDSKHRFLLLWSAGFLLSLAVSIRNSALLPILLVLIANVLLDKTFPKISQQLFMIPIGFISGLIPFFVMIISQNNLEYYLQDTVIGPVATSNLDAPAIFLKNVFEFPLVSLLLITVIFFVGGFLFNRFRDVFSVLAFTLISLCSFYNPSIVTQWIIGVDVNTQNTLYGSFLSIFQHLSIIFAMIYFVYLVACRFKWLPIKLYFNEFEVLLIGLGFCAISPIYPLGDLGHLWWGSPLLVTFSLGLFTKINSEFVDYRFLVSLLGSVLAVSFVCWGMQFTAPREKIEDESIFQNMYVSAEYVDDFRATTQFITRLPRGSTRFNCNDGAFSVWNKKYLSSDPNFVGWGWSQVAVNINLNFEVYCAQSARDAWIRARDLNGLVIDSNLLGTSAIVSGRFSKHSFDRENFLYLIKVKDS
jgi:hypothetical protein